MEKWIALITPATAFFGFLMTVVAVGLLRFKMDDMSRVELTRQLGEWRQWSEDSNKMLVAIREEQKASKAEIQRHLGRVRELDEECMDLTRERRATDEYIRRLQAACRQAGVPVPVRPEASSGDGD